MKNNQRLHRGPPRLTRSAPRLTPAPKEAEPFYSSKEWVALRDFVLKRDGEVCIDKGQGKCEGRPYVDHIIEIRDGGELLDPENCTVRCARHHTLKSNAERAKRFATPV
jgi:5-methylcytosine-specific restriction protein A